MPLSLDRAKRDLGGEKLLAAAIVESPTPFLHPLTLTQCIVQILRATSQIIIITPYSNGGTQYGILQPIDFISRGQRCIAQAVRCMYVLYIR